MEAATLALINRERGARRPVVIVTDIVSGAQRVILHDAMEPDVLASEPLAQDVVRLLRANQSGIVEKADARYFIKIFAPLARLVIVGAVHISQVLAPMARMLDYDAVIIDPRTSFATKERFPNVEVLAQWPDEAFATMPLDAYTALVSLTHDPKIDDEALRHGLASTCFYIGALGSRKTHARRVTRLADAGMSEAQIARIHAPVGLDIGAISPAEIALAIMAQITQTLRGTKIRRGETL